MDPFHALFLCPKENPTLFAEGRERSGDASIRERGTKGASQS